MSAFHCCICGEIVASGRFPSFRGWHVSVAGEAYCAECWHAAYVIRAITIPVAGPVGLDWPELRGMLKDAWSRATRLANLAVQELMMHDCVRGPEMTKLPKMPRVNLYARFKLDVSGWTQSAASLLVAVEKKYRRTRASRIWQGATTLPNLRYPQPYPVHNARWGASYGPGGEPLVSITLPAGRVTLRLRGGDEFRRQLKLFGRLVGGKAKRGELSLYRVRADSGDHRSGMRERDGGGQQISTRVMCKMVGWFPREPSQERSGMLIVSPCPDDGLLVARNEKDHHLFKIHRDDLGRRTAEHRRRLQHLADDAKLEVRRDEKRPMASRRETWVHGFNGRMNAAVNEVAAQVANYANRRRFAQVLFVHGPSCLDSFRWSDLVRQIRYRCDALGISFEEKKQEDRDEKGPNSQAETQGPGV